ncbi:BCCT family transporter, partial [Bacillus sp. S1-R1J2-FB]|uniref:BCCT family transporter n=1 Tax=Bacillus sp. S1-R1J2-FB TaxID=1973494 RepID=UPI00148368EB
IRPLMIILLFPGPTNFIMQSFTATIGDYIQELPSMSFRLSPLAKGGNPWIQSWTIFYWAWWIAWSPFVGTFIARVSRGRTIREFVIGVLLVPTVIGALWFAGFGGTGLHMGLFGDAQIFENVKEMVKEEGLFASCERVGGVVSD